MPVRPHPGQLPPIRPGVPCCPLTQEQYDLMNQTLRDLNALQLDLQRAIRAGIDCKQRLQICNDIVGDLNGIKTEYFPGQP